MKKNILSLSNLHVSLAREEKEVLQGISITIKSGEIHAVMGPNGAGKTTLALSLMGHPGYNIKFPILNFQFQINGKDMINLNPEERARAGLFVSFQQPVEIQGVSVLAFLRTAYKALYPSEKIPLSEFKKQVADALKIVGLPEEFMQRSLNDGFSGGEKKRVEIVQLLILKPKFAVLDEIDSGLDIDSLKTIAKIIQTVAREKKVGVLIITHYQRILHDLKPDFVHILVDGIIKKLGDMTIVSIIEKNGYAALLR